MLIQNLTIPTFNGSQVIIDYYSGQNYTKGALLNYQGSYIPYMYIAPKSPLEKDLIWIFAVGGFAIILAIIILVSFYFYKVHKNEKHLDFIIDLLNEHKRLSPEEIEELKEKRDEFTISKKNLKIYYEFPLGNGASSTVYTGFLYGQSPLSTSTKLIETQRFRDCKVAVKVPASFGHDETEQLFHEIDSMKAIGYHEHIACMLGICFLDQVPSVVFELADKDLLSYVRFFQQAIDRAMIPFQMLFSILWQVARGMQFIASKHIVHRDLAARNILLTDRFHAKISDFGLSFCTTTQKSNNYDLPKKLPVKWFSIEALVDKIFSEKSDVWAFGVLMYEVFSFGQIPYKDFTLNELVTFLREGKRLNCPEAASQEAYQIMLSCWNDNPEDRANFKELVNKLHTILETATESYGYEGCVETTTGTGLEQEHNDVVPGHSLDGCVDQCFNDVNFNENDMTFKCHF